MINLYVFFYETKRSAIYGIGTYLRELTMAIKDSEINVCVIHLFSDKTDMEIDIKTDGISYWYIPAPIIGDLSYENNRQSELYYRNVVYLLRLQIKDTERLVFHLNNNHSGKLVNELRKTFDCRIIATAHYFDWSFVIYDDLQQLRKILNDKQSNVFGENFKKSIEEEKLFFSNVDHVICPSKYMYEVICRDFGLDSAKIFVISNGLTDGKNTISKMYFLRKKWIISSKEKIILFAGRLDKIKGVSYLIKAFREVLEKFPKCRLMIAGSGYYDMYFQEAKDICTKITFTGLLEKKELYELYQIADIGVVPSLFESFGFVAVEMMMHQLPIVATATSGLNEVVDDTCALKVPIISYSDRVEIDTGLFAKNILYLLQHSKKSKKMGYNGRKRYLKEYSSEVFRRNMMNFYQSLFIYDTTDNTSNMGGM